MAVAAACALVLTVPLPALAAPTIGGTATATYEEGSPATPIATELTLTGGGSYAGQFLHFAVEGATATETLGLETVADPRTGAGEVSVVGSTVYLGNGSSADPIGSISSTHNGRNGADLRVNFSSEFQNAGFETGDLTGWTAVTEQVDLGSTEIAGCPTVDTSTYPVSVPNEDDNPAASPGTMETPVVEDEVVPGFETSEGTYSLRLLSNGVTTAQGFDVVHGPAVHSTEFQAAEGDTISFDWQANAGGDNYHVFGYIVDEDCNQTELLDATGGGNTAWATVPTEIPASGTYRFVFVSGTHDFSGGLAAGASLFIDDVQVFGSRVDDAVAQAVARLLTYTNTSDDPPASRTITVTAQSVDEGSGSGTIALEIVAPAPEPEPEPEPEPDPEPGDPFVDAVGHVFAEHIAWMRAEGITKGCNPPANDRFCPDAFITRAEVGTFLDRLLHLPGTGVDAFGDDAGNVHEEALNRASAAGVYRGCNPPTNDRVCPDDTITRGELAAVLARSVPYGVDPVAPFDDTDGHVFELETGILAAAGITKGCDPPANDRFCPDRPITRGEVAAFFHRSSAFLEP